MATPGLFSTLWDSYNTNLVQASENAATNLIVAMAPWIVGAVTLAIMALGVAVMMGKVDIGRLGTWIVRAFIVTSLLTAGNYTTYIMTPFLTTIPQAISSALGVTPDTLTVAQQFDALDSALDHFSAVLLTASSGWMQLGQWMTVMAGNFFASLMLAGCFVVAFITASYTALVAPVGCVLIIFYLFDNTRHIAERWISKMIALMVLQLMVSILISIVLAQFQSYMAAAEQQSVSGVNAAQLISVLFHIGYTFGFGLFMLISLPTLASAVAGSQVSSVIIAPIRYGSTQMISVSNKAGAWVGAAARNSRGAS